MNLVIAITALMVAGFAAVAFTRGDNLVGAFFALSALVMYGLILAINKCEEAIQNISQSQNKFKKQKVNWKKEGF